MSKLHASYLVWGAGWLLLYFLAFELLPVFWPGCPWDTFTATTRGALKAHPWVGTPLMGVIIFLPTHLLFGRNVWASLAFGMAVAVAAHLVNHVWP